MIELKNLNPTGKKKNDCVVRSIMTVTNQTWSKVYKELCYIGLKKFNMPNSKEVYEEYLRRLGWKKMPMPKKWHDGIEYTSGVKKVKKFYKRYTVEEFVLIKKGPVIISMANHLTAAIDGKIIDTWNCGYKSVGNYWVK